MGMFDHYIPDPPLRCPRCEQDLSGWQGKGGLNLLNHWSQRSQNAVDTDWDEQDMVGTKEEFLSSQTHPDGEFLIYTDCSACGLSPVYANVSIKEGQWESCALVKPEEVEKAFYHLPKAQRTAIRKAIETRG